MKKEINQFSAGLCSFLTTTFLWGSLCGTLAQAPAPAPLEVTHATANTIALSWNDIYSDENGFRLTRWDDIGNGTLFEFGPNVTNYLDTNLVTDVNYSYRIVAFNSGGESAPAFTSAMTTPIPGPAPLLVTAVTANTIGLVWNDIYDNEDGFRLIRWDDIGNGTLFEFGPNVTNYLDTNLVTDVNYSYRIVAFNSGGESAPAFTSAMTTPIPGPAPLLVTAVTANTIGLVWNDIYDNEDGFRLIRWDDIGNGTLFEFGPNVTNYLDTNLVTDVNYSYRIVAFNSGGESAPAFTSAMTTPIPGPAPLLVTAVTANTIGLVWNDIYDNEDGFRLIRWDDIGNGTLFEFGPNVTNYLDTNLVTDVNYSYRIVAFNSGGESAPAFTSAMTTPIPGPAPLLVTAVTANTIGLVWNDIYDNEDGFRLIRWDDIGNGTLFEFGPNVTNYLDTNLVTDVNYSYRIVAFNSGGESAPAFTSAMTTPIPAPDPLVITGATAFTIGLSWNDIYDNEDGFRIERSTDSVNFSPIATVGANLTSYSSAGLSPSTTYYYRVAAFNFGGDSYYSTTASATTQPFPPFSPSGVVASVVSQTQINLSWTDNANNETGFQIERSTDGVSFVLLANVGSNVTNYANTGLSPLTLYYYRVSAFNTGGTSAASNVGSATTPDYIPAAPSALSATAVSASQINLTWTDNAANETGFKLFISTDGVNFTQLANVGGNMTSFSSGGLSPVTTYSYRVTAYNASGDSVPSGVAAATTLDIPPAAASGLLATAVSSNRVNLAWTDNANNETGYWIERSTDGINFSQIASVGANVTSFTNTGLSASTSYSYRVRATNSAGSSGYSNTATATTGAAAPPAAPSSLALTVISSSQINLHWNDNSSNETQFLIERSLNGSTFTQIATVGANVRNYSAIGLQRNTRYYFRVRGTNSAGNSGYSNTANAKTLR